MFKITYPIPGNSTSLQSLLLYYTIFRSTIQQGLYKERYLFLCNSLSSKYSFNVLLSKFYKYKSINFKFSKISRFKKKIFSQLNLLNSYKNFLARFKNISLFYKSTFSTLNSNTLKYINYFKSFVRFFEKI